MNRSFLRFAVSFGFALFCFTLFVGAASSSLADDWPQYRGLGGDGKSSESIGPLDWSNGVTPVWKVPTALGFSSFAVADGRAFTIVVDKDQSGSDAETCLALDAATGKELWKMPLGSNQYDGGGGNAGAPDNRGGDGPRSTPTVSDGRVYVYTAHLRLVCLDAETGNLIWDREIVDDFAGRNIKWSNATSPLVDDRAVYVAGGGAGQSFLAFEKATGELLWKSGDEKLTHATPALSQLNGEKQIVFFMQSGLIGVDAATGQQRWLAEFPFSVSTAASPVVAGQQVYCSAGYGVGAGLFQVTRQPIADEVWFEANQLMNHWSTPVVLDGHLYGMFEFKKYGKAPLQCVELATGEIKWKERGFGPGNCILVGDKLVALSDAGVVAVVEARPDQYKELARAKVIEGKCWSTPTFADGHLFVRSTKEGACIKMD